MSSVKLKIMSMVLEGKTSLNNLEKAIKTLKEVEKEVNTVFFSRHHM